MAKTDKKHNRREFIIAITRKIVLGGLSAIAIALGYKNLNNDSQSCAVNLPCRRCFKLGSCAEEVAVKTRKKIKRTDKIKG